MTRICTSIAVERLSDLVSEIEQSFEAGTDYVEIRFDFLNLHDIEKAVNLVEPFKKKSVYTLRSHLENGKFKGSEYDRFAFLKKLAESKPMFLDIELSTLKSNDELADYLDGQSVSLLVSYHNFTETPEIEILKDILNEMRIYSNYNKVVTSAKTIDDSIKMLDLYENLNGLNLIAFAMGDLGIMTRILCTVVGDAPFTYAASKETIAPGQLNLKILRKIYDNMKLKV
jgi:3-dehydroquinate dehydratase-1